MTRVKIPFGVLISSVLNSEKLKLTLKPRSVFWTILISFELLLSLTGLACNVNEHTITEKNNPVIIFPKRVENFIND
jgi:hypothetical protein